MLPCAGVGFYIDVMKSGQVKVCLFSWVTVSGLVATTHLLLLGVDPFIVMAQATGGLQPSWIIGECVRRLSLLLLVSP